MPRKLRSLIAPMMLAAFAVTSVAFAQQPPAQRGQMGGGMMQPGDGTRGNMMHEGAMPGTSVPPEQMANCRRMMQGGDTATGDATREMLDRCRSMMQQEPPQAAPTAPDKKE